MTVYFFVAMLIVAVALEAQLVTLVTGAGTAILGGLSVFSCWQSG